ncbi:MAG: hypothetical protein V3U45_03480, partial [bacterium]
GMMSAQQQAAQRSQEQTYNRPYQSPYQSSYQSSSFYPAQPAVWTPASFPPAGSGTTSQELAIELERQRALEAELELMRQRNEELDRELALLR